MNIFDQAIPPDLIINSGAFADIQNAVNAGPSSPTRKWRVAARGNYTGITKAITIPSYVSLDLTGAFLQADGGGVLAGTTTYEVLRPGSGTVNVNNVEIFGGVIDCNLQAVRGIVMDQAAGSTTTSDCLIFGTKIINAGRDAAFLIFGKDNLVDGCIADTGTPQVAGGANGFWVTGTSTARVKISNCIARNGVRANNVSSNGFVCDDGTQRITFDNCFAYANAGDGFHIVASSGTHSNDIAVLNCRAMDNTNASSLPKGLYAQYCDYLQVQNGFFSGNSASGIWLDNCKSAMIATNVVKNNDQTQNSIGGIHYANAARGTIIGNLSFDDQGVATQQWGIMLDTGAATCFLAENTLYGNISGGVNIVAGTDHWIINNRGYNPQAISGTLTAGASPFTDAAQQYPYIFALQAVNGLTAITLDAVNMPITINQPILVNPGHTLILTWATTAPTYKRIPL